MNLRQRVYFLPPFVVVLLRTTPSTRCCTTWPASYLVSGFWSSTS